MKRQINPRLASGAETLGNSATFRKHNSVDNPKVVQSTASVVTLSKTTSLDASSSPYRQVKKSSSMAAPPPSKPLPALSRPVVIAKSPIGDSNVLYHNISADFLSVSPLQPSPSMLLLNRTAEVLIGDGGKQNMRRMPVSTTTQVFEVRKAPPPAPRLSRQESLLAVFKPATDDEDNLVVKSQTSFRFNAEERALRERAAYVLDKAYSSFSGVPATALARVHNNNGSLQEYVKSDGTAEDNPHLVGKATAEEVQRIAILDCRIMNLDRHGGNVLVRKLGTSEQKSAEDDSIFFMGEDLLEESGNDLIIKLTPIDHSLCLPPWSSLGEAWFDWSYWPQTSEMLTQNTKNHIEALDVEADERRLLELGIKVECIATNRICTMALQELAREVPDLTLKTLADFYQRPYSAGHKLHDLESPLEHLVNEACIRAGVRKDVLSPPGHKFYREFQKVLREQISSGTWKSYVV